MQCRGIYYNTSLCLKNSETLCFNFKPKSGEIKHLVSCLLIKFCLYMCSDCISSCKQRIMVKRKMLGDTFSKEPQNPGVRSLILDFTSIFLEAKVSQRSGIHSVVVEQKNCLCSAGWKWKWNQCLKTQQWKLWKTAVLWYCSCTVRKDLMFSCLIKMKRKCCLDMKSVTKIPIRFWKKWSLLTFKSVYKF